MGKIVTLPNVIFVVISNFKLSLTAHQHIIIFSLNYRHHTSTLPQIIVVWFGNRSRISGNCDESNLHRQRYHPRKANMPSSTGIFCQQHAAAGPRTDSPLSRWLITFTWLSFTAADSSRFLWGKNRNSDIVWWLWKWWHRMHTICSNDLKWWMVAVMNTPYDRQTFRET